MKIVDVEAERTVEVEGRWGAIFVSCGDLCIELDWDDFLQGLKDEFGLVYDWDIRKLQAA